MIKCPICQFDNEDGVLFCEQCKSDLSEMPPAEPDSEHWVKQPDSSYQPAVMEEAAPASALEEEAPPAQDFAAAEAGEEMSAGAAVAEAVVVSESFSSVLPAEAAPPFEAAPDSTPPAAEPVSEGTEFPPGTNPKLIVLRGQRINAEYPIYEGENFIGRADEKAVDIDLEDQEPAERIWSSRQHALITYEGGKLAIEDLNSTNGTFVNRLRVHPGQKRSLQVNDVIQIGTVQMRVTV